MSKYNLNKYNLLNVDNSSIKFQDNSTISKDKKIQVYFRNIESHLIEEIDKAEIVVGCVAWMTAPKILKILAKKKAVSIIVQKEDFLRPDIGQQKGGLNRKNLRLMYNQLKGGLERIEFKNILSSVSYLGDPDIGAVRCVGSKRKFYSPIMHNKFLIFCKYQNPIKYTDEEGKEFYENSYGKVIPYAVWTGSFNFSKSASNCLENAVVIKDIHIARAYYKEYGQICAMSEPLDWTSEWVEPPWRIGT